MQTRGSKKFIDTMTISKPSTTIEVEKIDPNLMAIQNKYLENDFGVNQIKMGVMYHMDTWRDDPNLILLQHIYLEVLGKGNFLAQLKRDVMIDQELRYFVPYESFTCHEILYSVAHRLDQKGYEVVVFKDQQQEEGSKPKLELIFDYAPDSIMQAIVIPTYWTFHVKK